MGRLDGTIALVTGGATGLGRAVSRRLSAEGAGIAIFDREPADAVVRQIAETGCHASAWRCDLKDEGRLRLAMAGVEERFGRVDILVNACDLAASNKTWYRLKTGDIQQQLDVVAGFWLAAGAAYRLLKRSPRGRVVNAVAWAGTDGRIDRLPALVPRGALEALTRALAEELKPDGISANAVLSGFAEAAGSRGRGRPVVRRAHAAGEDQGSLPGDAAGLVAFLVSDEAAGITGQTLVPEGAAYLH